MDGQRKMSKKEVNNNLHNKALHLTAIPLRSIAAGELCRYKAQNIRK